MGDDAMKEALADLVSIGSTLRVLGSFPAWSGAGVVPSIVDLNDLSPGLNAGFSQSFPVVPWEES